MMQATVWVPTLFSSLFFNFHFFRQNPRRREDELPHHVAHKKIPVVSDDGSSIVTPTDINGAFVCFSCLSGFSIWISPRSFALFLLNTVSLFLSPFPLPSSLL